MKIHINGEERDVAETVTVAVLLDQLKLESRYTAVEVNLQVVPRARHGEFVLNPGDRLEIVTLVGGG